MWKFLAYEDASQGKRVRFCIDAETEYKRESAAYVDCLALVGQYSHVATLLPWFQLWADIKLMLLM